MSKRNTSATGNVEDRVISVSQLRSMRDRGLNTVDQLTAASGYGQIAILKAVNCGCHEEIKKIVDRVNKAAVNVQTCLAAVELLVREQRD